MFSGGFDTSKKSNDNADICVGDADIFFILDIPLLDYSFCVPQMAIIIRLCFLVFSTGGRAR